jgi:hypothetical protein
MTVQELIKRLNKAKQTAEVTILDDYDHEKDIIRVEVYKDIVIIVENQR